MNRRIISIIAVTVLFFGLSFAAFGDDSEGAGSTAVVDGSGQTFYYTQPTEHIVTMGYGSTLTVAMLGNIDKIIAVDTYSTYEYTKDERLKDLNAKSLGSIYSASNNDKIVTQFLQWVEEGQMNLDDSVILTSYTNAFLLRTQLNAVGFSKVLVFPPAESYDDITDFVRCLSIIVTGGVSVIAEDMLLVKQTISDGLKDAPERAKGLGVWYYASDFSVINTGFTASLIEAAGGINVAHNPSVPSSSYGDTTTIVQLVDANPGLTIFLPANYTRDHTVGEFRNNVLGGDSSVTIVAVEANWNNYCPLAAEGLWAAACAMYPDLFEGPIPHTEEPTKISLLSYAVAGITISLLILVVAYFMMNVTLNRPARRSSSRLSHLKRRRTTPDPAKRERRLLLTIISLAVIMVLSILLDLSWAASPLSLKEVLDALFGNGTWANNIIVNTINAPRVVFGVFVGAALGVTGGVMQAVFRNPLASPYLLGLSSGAALGAAIAILSSIPLIPLAISQPALAFVFCLGTMLLVYMLSRSGGNVRTETLILAGVAISSLIAAAVSLLTYIAPSEKMGDIVFWSMGSLSKVTWEEMSFAIPVIVVGIVMMLLHTKNLNAMMLGDSHAMDLGVDVKKVRLFLLIVSSLVVAAAVAFVGAIGFIGLVIPHIFRLLLGPDNRIILPLSAFGGAAFILLCDYVAHMVAPYYGVMPIGVVTAFVGAPFFIYLLSRKRSEVGW